MRLFQDAAGTIPAYEAGQPIGKVVRAAGTMDATQGTALSRPTLARWPKGGRRNLLTPSENFLDPLWQRGADIALVEAVGVAPPPGASKVFRVTKIGSANVAIFAPGRVSSGQRKSIWVRTVSGTGRAALLGYYNFPKYQFDVSEEWRRVDAPSDAAETGGTAFYAVDMRLASGGGSDIYIAAAQLETGPLTPYQRVTTANDITEAGVHDVWHLYNDGGDSLPAVLPAGAYEIAWVTPLGAVSYASVTSDGTTGTELLRAERMADVLAREGAFTPAEKTALEAYWHQRYAA